MRLFARLFFALLLALVLPSLPGCADEDVVAERDAVGSVDASTDAVAGDTAGDVLAPPTATVAELNAWGDGVPVRAGERLTIEGVATVTSGVIVSGSRYLKLHVQDDTGGVAVFADTQATVVDDGYDGSVLGDVFVRRGDLVRVTGVVGAHEGLVELRPQLAGDVEVLGHGEPLPAPLVFANLDALYAAGREPIGSLVRLDNLRLAGAATWPELGRNEKGVRFVAADAAGDDGPAVLADIYTASGIPGSVAPVGPFGLVGLLRVSGDTLQVFPRSIADVHPVDERLSGSLRVTRADDAEWGYDLDVATVPAFLYEARTAVLVSDLLDGAAVPRPQDYTYKVIARDGRQPFDTVDSVMLRQAYLVQSLDRDGAPVEGSVDVGYFEALDLSPLFSLGDVGEVRLFPVETTGPQVGEGPCSAGLNVWIQGEVLHVPFDELPAETVELGGASYTATPLDEVVSDAIVGRYSFDGFLTPNDVRRLYLYRVEDEAGGGADVQPENLTATWLVSDSGSVLDATGATLLASGLCHVRANRRFVVHNGDAEATVLLSALAEAHETVTAGEADIEAVPVDAIVEASGVRGDAAATSFDYVLAPADYPGGVRLPYGHNHLTALYWWDQGMRTVSLDDVGDLLDGDGAATFGGVAGAGWSSIKALLEIRLETAPDPENTVTAGPGDYTDPTSCTGCHAKRGDVVIPVSCVQCH